MRLDIGHKSEANIALTLCKRHSHCICVEAGTKYVTLNEDTVHPSTARLSCHNRCQGRALFAGCEAEILAPALNRNCIACVERL